MFDRRAVYHHATMFDRQGVFDEQVHKHAATESISMPKGHGFALTPYKGALVHLCYETLKNKFNFLSN